MAGDINSLNLLVEKKCSKNHTQNLYTSASREGISKLFKINSRKHEFLQQDIYYLYTLIFYQKKSYIHYEIKVCANNAWKIMLKPQAPHGK